MLHTFTFDGMIEGARKTFPLMPGTAIFAMAFGAAAAQKNLPFDQMLLMTAFVYAGASQMVALEMWQQVWSWSTLLTAMSVTAVVNARMFLMGVAIQPWLSGAPTWRTILKMFFMTDGTWLVTMRYQREGGTDRGFLLGSGLAMWLLWALMCILGYVAGALVPDPHRFGFDMIMPIFFSAMLIPLWQGMKTAQPWVIAGIVAVVVHALVPGYGYIIAGALAGALAGAYLP